MRIEEVINKYYSKLNENDLYILKYILNNKKECSSLGINELAKRCNISKTTILRLTHKLAFNGYSEFKVFLKWEEENNKRKNSGVVELEELIYENIKLISQKDFTDICRIIHNADRVFVHGTGTAQTTIARELKRMFLAVRKYLDVIEGTAELEIVKSSITEKDVFIIVSLSGETSHLESFVNELNIRGIKYISITKLGNNMISRKTPHNMYISTSVIDLGNGVEYETTTLFFIVIEALIRKYISLYFDNGEIN
ncbi:MAG: MurR/RpiR family transcriptional regulator [Clostridium sp.]|uniref:MurR/RpiR family transcriptional regulator n=1 Tax=Clostridium sp. TaxID=1506 RepID=UPI003F3412DA